MKRRVFTLLTLALCSFALLWQGQADAAPQAKAARVLVLPFQINGGTDLDYLNEELPALFAQRLAAKGLQVVPYKETLERLRKQKVGQLDLASVRRLATQARADYAVYGTFNETGAAFSIDARMVETSGSQSSQPLYAERNSLIELLSAVDELVDRMNGSMRVVAEPSAAPQERQGGIIDIQIRGLKVLDPDVVLMRLATRKGDAVDPASINEEVKRIWDLGYFSDVTADLEPSGKGQILVFTVVEKPRISDVVVNGSDAVSKDDILATMSSKTGSVLNERLLVDDIQKVTDLYRKEGFYLVQIDYKIEQQPDNPSALLVFNVEEGKKLYIKDIKFEGLEGIDPDDLKKQLALQERTILSWITGTGVLREEYLERDSAAITAYALNNGYMDIQVGVPRIDYDEEGITITFAVNEGKRYDLGEISFGGDLIDTDKRLFEVISSDEQKENLGYFNLSIVQNDIKALTDFYSDYGYAFAEVDLRTRKDPDAQTIDVIFVVDKKQKVYIRRVETEGNTRTRDNVIFRELRLGDGDPFDGSKLRRSNERLNRLRYFTQVDTSILPTDKEDEVDLKVNLKEDRTGVISAGVGYSTLYQFGVSGNIMERNLFGKGYSLGLSGFVSGKSTSVNLNFVNPRIYDTNLGVNNNTYAVWEEWDDFEKKTVGNTIRFFYPIGEYTSVSAGYRLDHYTLYNIPDYASRAYKEYEGTNLSSVLSAGIYYDSTDSRERPTRGFMGRVFAEYGGGGLGGNDNFVKPIVELQSFYTLFKNPNHVFHWRSRVGAVFENTDKPVPVFDRFFIGGMDTIRGYATEDLAPRDPVYHDEIGGDRMGFVNLEYVWTFHEDLGLSLVPFFDIGFSIDSDQTSDPFNELKKSVGLELRWRSPMGDMRFAYGYALDKNVKGERPGGRFEFSMGQFF